MNRVSVSLLTSLVLAATLPALAGESPYNPGAPSNSSVLAKIPVSYYCSAQGNGESKGYVTGFEAAPGFETPEYKAFQANASQAFTQYMYATYGQRKVLYPHCTVGSSESVRPSWEQMQHDPRYKETVHVNWHYGQADKPASDAAG
jgi:hypothetical protein